MNNNYTGFDQFDDDALEYFIENLPHGSGINCEWSGNIPETGDYVYISNSYQCMNENGFYDGYQDFSIRILRVDFARLMDFYQKYEAYQYIPSKERVQGLFNATLEMIKDDFVLQFNNGQYKAERYMLRDYLEDTIRWSLSGMKL
jgi:hypothetical protein